MPRIPHFVGVPVRTKTGCWTSNLCASHLLFKSTNERMNRRIWGKGELEERKAQSCGWMKEQAELMGIKRREERVRILYRQERLLQPRLLLFNPQQIRTHVGVVLQFSAQGTLFHGSMIGLLWMRANMRQKSRWRERDRKREARREQEEDQVERS